MNNNDNLLKKLGVGAIVLGVGAISLNSLENFPSENENGLIVEGYISKIPGDKLSDSFYKNEKQTLLESVETKIEKFYDFNFNIDVNFSNPSELNKESLGKKNVAINYMTMKNMLETPRDILYSFGGQELLDELETEIKRARKVGGWDYETAENIIFDTVKEGVYQRFSGEGGFGSEISHRAWVFPSKIYERKAENNNELANAYAFTMCHELGHILGLEHTNEKNNFMNPRLRLEDILDFNFEMNSFQVEQLRDYLNKD